ncbi:MAG: acyl-CoA dehydrogenase [Caldilineaceae bacterium]
MQALASYLNRAATQQVLTCCEEQRTYPQMIRRQLHRLGLSHFFVDDVTGTAATQASATTTATLPHLMALSALCTSASASLGIDVGVNGLGLIPIYLGATTEQLSWVAARMTQGAFCSLLLTEIAHGSNLLANETYAEAGTLTTAGHFVPLAHDDNAHQPTHYRLNGNKDLINGGSQHELLVLFARTRGEQPIDRNSRPSAQGDFSLFLLDRREGGAAITSPHRWHTLPTPAADIASVRLQDVLVPATQRIGAAGSGFRLVQQTLGITRGGVSAFAVGLANRAVQLTCHYGQTRRIYGSPILALGAIADHLLHCRALELLITAMSLKATALLNACGVGGGYYAHVAKYACCTLAEALVTEGRLLHGAAALLVARPYHRLIGDVLLFGAFDGTTHLTLEQIQWRLAQLAAQPTQTTAPKATAIVEQMRHLYQTPPQPLRLVAQQRSRTLLHDPGRYLQELAHSANWAPVAPLIQVSEALLTLVRHCRDGGQWETDQGLRFTLGKLGAWLETLVALVEWTDPGTRRALGLPPRPTTPDDQALYTFAFGWFGGQLLAELQMTMARCGLVDLVRSDEVAAALGRLYREGRDQLYAELQQIEEDI